MSAPLRTAVRVAALVTLAFAGILGVVAPWLSWFHVSATIGARFALVRLAGTAYGTAMTLLSGVGIIAALALRRPPWRRSWWPIIGAVAMAMVLSAGLRGLLLSERAAADAIRGAAAERLLGTGAGDGFRRMVEAAFAQGTLTAEVGEGPQVAAAAGALGTVASVPLLSAAWRRQR